ncbi:MAG: hypothetical protein EBQ96_09370 [Proteobacteria bacterium]|nr:hypothetical protein [Pseudomonadota bacterium]
MADRRDARPEDRVEPVFGTTPAGAAAAALDPSAIDAAGNAGSAVRFPLLDDPRYQELELALSQQISSNWRRLEGRSVNRPLVNSAPMKALAAAALEKIYAKYIITPAALRSDFMSFALTSEHSLNPDLLRSFETEIKAAIGEYERDFAARSAAADAALGGAASASDSAAAPRVPERLPTDPVTLFASADDDGADTPAEDAEPRPAARAGNLDISGLFGPVAADEANDLLDKKTYKRGMDDNAIRIITHKFPGMLRQPALLAYAKQLADADWAAARRALGEDSEEPVETEGDYQAWFNKKLENPADPAIKKLKDAFKESWPYVTDVGPDGSKTGILSYHVDRKNALGLITGHNYLVFEDHQQNKYFYDGTRSSVQLRGETRTKEGIVPAEKFGKKHAEYLVTALVKDRSGRLKEDGSVKDYTITVGASGLFGRDRCQDLCALATLKAAYETGSMSALTLAEPGMLMGSRKLDKIPDGYFDKDALRDYPEAATLIKAYNERKTVAPAPAPGPAAAEPDAAEPVVALERRRASAPTGVPRPPAA